MGKRGGRRPETRFLLFSEKWLFGSTRTELAHDERAIWTDFLSLASLNGGKIEVPSREQLASQLCASVELINRSIEKFIKAGKIHRKYNKREKKEIFAIVKWEHYQPQYLWTDPKKLDKKKRSTKPSKNDSYVSDKRKEKKEKENKEKERGEEEKDLTDTHLPPNLPFKTRDRIIELRTDIRHEKETMNNEKSEEMKKFHLDNINAMQAEITDLLKDCT